MTHRWTQAKMAALAVEERQGLGLDMMDRLDPYLLCAEHGVAVYAFDELEAFDCPAATLEHFTNGASKWSAALVPVGSARLIIENTAHEMPRRRSNIAHEMSHLLLEHEFDDLLLGEDHERLFDAMVEKEALYLSGEILVPSEACKRMAFRDRDNAAVAEQFGVSLQFAQMRMRGPRVMATNARRKQARHG